MFGGLGISALENVLLDPGIQLCAQPPHQLLINLNTSRNLSFDEGTSDFLAKS
jgi:hypothetical protein